MYSTMARNLPLNIATRYHKKFSAENQSMNSSLSHCHGPALTVLRHGDEESSNGSTEWIQKT